MMAEIVQKTALMALALVALVAAGGCAASAPERPPGQPVTGPPPQGTAAGQAGGRYYLDDVEVPPDLTYDSDESIVYETPTFKAGVLRFSKWRLDVPWLIEFFMVNMEKNQWTFVNAFKGKETLLSFSKPEKTCLIRITETWTGMTEVEIAVGPLGGKKG